MCSEDSSAKMSERSLSRIKRSRTCVSRCGVTSGDSVSGDAAEDADARVLELPAEREDGEGEGARYAGGGASSGAGSLCAELLSPAVDDDTGDVRTGTGAVGTPIGNGSVLYPGRTRPAYVWK